MGGPKGWGPKKKVANVEIYVIFEVFAFCGGRTKTDFKDRGDKAVTHRAAQLPGEYNRGARPLSLKSVLVLRPQKAKTSKIT